MYQLYHKTSIHHTVLYPALYHNLWFIYHLYIDVGVAIVTLAALISTQCPIKPLEEELFSISHTWFFSSTLLTFYWDINSVHVHICSQKYHMHWGQMLTFNMCMESLWDIAQVKLVQGSGWQPELSLRRCSPVRGIWSGRRRSGRASSTFLSQTHRSGPWATVGVFLRWECTWGSRWGRRREGECRLAPLLSHEKPQSGCRRLTSNIVRIRYNFRTCAHRDHDHKSSEEAKGVL